MRESKVKTPRSPEKSKRSPAKDFPSKSASPRKSSPDKTSPRRAAGKNKAKNTGYLDIIANQEANLISMTSLQEGEEFEKDINNIIGIIDGVEKNMNPHRLTT